MTETIKSPDDLTKFYAIHQQEKASGTAWWNQTRLVRSTVDNKPCIEMRSLTFLENLLKVITLGFYRADSKQSVIDASKDIGGEKLKSEIIKIFNREFAPELAAEPSGNREPLDKNARAALAGFNINWKSVLKLIDDKKIGLNETCPELTHNTPLIAAAIRDDTNAMKELLQRGANPNIAGRDGRTAICAAAGCNNLEGVQMLLAKGAKITFQDKNKRSALMQAAFQPNVNLDTIKLLANKETVNLQDKKGKTALMLLVEFCLNDDDTCNAVQALLDAGANKNLTDEDGKTAYNLVQEQASPKLRKLLT